MGKSRERILLEQRIKGHGFAVRYVEFCEDARTPGFLGQIRGVVDRELREVKISRRANPTEADMEAILTHELRHLEEPAWQCNGKVDVPMTTAAFRDALDELGWSAVWVADRVNVSASAVKSWRGGTRPLPADVAAWVAEALVWLRAHPAPRR